MSYLKFDKNLMINLEQSLPKEMLRTNQSGAYHCTTIVDCNTRKQHGLLVVPCRSWEIRGMSCYRRSTLRSISTERPSIWLSIATVAVS